MKSFIPITFLLMATPVIADSFVATQSCPLYQSKNKLTNPDELMSKPGTEYKVLEVLGHGNKPDWVRISTTAQRSPERWLAGKCGTLQQDSDNNPLNGVSNGEHGATKDTNAKDSGIKHNKSLNSGRCDIAGEQDGHVLALSWQGAFCELYGKGKRECDALSRSRHDERWLNLTLHGLWPNKNSCGTNYGFCGDVKQKAKGFCNYPEVPLNADAKKHLDSVMPSADFNSCLDRHQWWKHGSCQALNASDYFIEAARLTGLVNHSKMALALRDSSGKMQSTARLRQLFTAEFGKHGGKRISFHCSRDLLTEIRLSLPATLNSTLDINQLMAQDGAILRDSCPANFMVDAPG